MSHKQLISSNSSNSQCNQDAAELALDMQLAMDSNAGQIGKYDAARKVFQAKEKELLNGIARGDACAFQRLADLCKCKLSFPSSIAEGTSVDYSPSGAARNMYYNEKGDFPVYRDERNETNCHPALAGATLYTHKAPQSQSEKSTISRKDHLRVDPASLPAAGGKKI